jgi:hypothetical protein
MFKQLFWQCDATSDSDLEEVKVSTGTDTRTHTCKNTDMDNGADTVTFIDSVSKTMRVLVLRAEQAGLLKLAVSILTPLEWFVWPRNI